jgi:hypothetical protein
MANSVLNMTEARSKDQETLAKVMEAKGVQMNQ